jgi:hypothetical protein
LIHLPILGWYKEAVARFEIDVDFCCKQLYGDGSQYAL